MNNLLFFGLETWSTPDESQWFCVSFTCVKHEA